MKVVHQTAGCNNKIRLLMLMGIGLVLLMVIIVINGSHRKQIDMNSTDKKVTSFEQTRTPHVAGQFYPARNAELEQAVKQLLDQADKSDLFVDVRTNPALQYQNKPLVPRILIVPHAGYVYSGSVAAAGFQQLKIALDANQTNIDRVVLIGSSHNFVVNQPAVYQGRAWETPLGSVLIDQSAVTELIETNLFTANNQFHAVEHSLEVQLPFLQTVLSDYKLIPILVGHIDENKLPEVAAALAKIVTDKTLLVISSDLSHYPNYQTANQIDAEVLEAIETGDVEQFRQVAANITAPHSKDPQLELETDLDFSQVDTRACGQQAIEIGMLLAQSHGWDQIKTIDYANSGDVTGDKQRVVGYGVVGFFSSVTTSQISEDLDIEKPGFNQNHSFEFSDHTQQQFSQQLLNLARQALQAAVSGEPLPVIDQPADYVTHPRFDGTEGAFVTLRKDGRLRGCIGAIESDQPLKQTVPQMARSAALGDPRFPSVVLAELDEIQVEVSVLTKPELISDPSQVEVGKHGLIIVYRGRKGVFLPQVATEFGYDKEQFLSQLCSHKIGAPSNCWRSDQAQIFVFEADVFEEEF